MDKSLSEQIIAHIEKARAFERNRQPTLRVDSSRSSTRTECLMCGVGIRKETFAKLANDALPMHPNCKKINDDPTLVLTMNVNTHAARAIMDRLYVQLKRNDADIKKEAAEKAAHAALLKRFEASEETFEEASA